MKLENLQLLDSLAEMLERHGYEVKKRELEPEPEPEDEFAKYREAAEAAGVVNLKSVITRNNLSDEKMWQITAFANLINKRDAVWEADLWSLQNYSKGYGIKVIKAEDGIELESTSVRFRTRELRDWFQKEYADTIERCKDLL